MGMKGELDESFKGELDKVNKVQMVPRRYWDIFPAAVCEAQELWEQVRLCRRLRVAGVKPWEAPHRYRLGFIKAVYHHDAFAPLSPIEVYLREPERSGILFTKLIREAMDDETEFAKLKAEMDRINRKLDDAGLRRGWAQRR